MKDSSDIMREIGGGILRRWLILIFTLFTVSCFPICAIAHPGDTNDDGGHYDRSTGEYHYHHGYPAHDHYDMDGDGIIDCPYDFDDKTGQNSGSSSSGRGYSYTHPQTTAPLPTEPKRKDVTGNLNNIFSVLATIMACTIVFAIVIAIQAHLYKNAKERLEIQNQKKTDENQKLSSDLTMAQSIHEADKKFIASLKEEATRLAEVDIKCEIYKKQYDTLLKMLQRKNQEAQLDGKSIENPVSKEELDKLRFKIEIPAQVIFGNDRLPVLLERGSKGQYGAYTVYTSLNSNIYHADQFCSGYTAQPTHLFRAINQGKRICKRCAYRLRVPDTIPEWYSDLKTLRSEIE